MVLYFKALNTFHIAGWSVNMEAPGQTQLTVVISGRGEPVPCRSHFPSGVLLNSTAPQESPEIACRSQKQYYFYSSFEEIEIT